MRQALRPSLLCVFVIPFSHTPRVREDALNTITEASIVLVKVCDIRAELAADCLR